MSTWQLRILAVGLFAIALACGIAFAAMHDEYASLRDGERIAGTVTRVEPRRTQLRVDIGYDLHGESRVYTAYPPLAEAAQFQVGAPVELVAARAQIIRASKIEGERPSLLLVPGAVVAFLLGVVTLLAPRRAAKRRAARRNPLDVVVDGLARTRNVMAGLVAFMLAAAVFFVVLLGAAHEASATDRSVIWVLTATTVGTAVILAFAVYRLRDPRNNAVMTLITERPHDIAWIYVQTVRAKGQTIQDAMIWTIHKKQHAIRLVPEDAEDLMAELERRAPHAMRPFSNETKKLYQEDPTRWRPRRSPSPAAVVS